ncbi:MAG: dihydrofolate reductase family protein, partial [Gemmatimonadaceae bacterium]
ALQKLRARDVRSLMVEGGAGLAASFLASGHVDRLVIFRSPIILGDGALGGFAGVASREIEHAPRFHLLDTHALGDDILSVYSMDGH